MYLGINYTVFNGPDMIQMWVTGVYNFYFILNRRYRTRAYIIFETKLAAIYYYKNDHYNDINDIYVFFPRRLLALTFRRRRRFT